MEESIFFDERFTDGWQQKLRAQNEKQNDRNQILRDDVKEKLILISDPSEYEIRKAGSNQDLFYQLK